MGRETPARESREPDHVANSEAKVWVRNWDWEGSKLVLKGQLKTETYILGYISILLMEQTAY